MSENTLPFQESVAGSIKPFMSAHSGKSRDLWFLPRAALREKEGFNVRTDTEEFKAKVREYADSIKANGFYPDKPISAFIEKEGDETVAYVTDGYTRLAAVDLAISEGAEIEMLPVVAVPPGTTAEDLTIGLVTKNAGRPLAPYEVGIVCKRLVDMGMDEKLIATRIAKSLPYVKNLLTLVSAPKSIRDMVTTGKVSATLAVETIKKEGSNAAKVLKAGVGAAQELGKSKVTKKTVKKATEPAQDQSKKQKKAKAVTEPADEAQQSDNQPTPVVDLSPLIRLMTSALDVVMKSPAWDTMSSSVQDIVTKAHTAGQTNLDDTGDDL